MAGVEPGEVDALIVVTCTPYEIMLDQDAFHIMRALGIDDGVAPLQVGAGCAGLARAAALLARMEARCALVLAYTLVSGVGVEPEGELNTLYKGSAASSAHPFADSLWMTAALFSDGAGALVLRRDAQARGVVLYSRDSQAFGEESGFEDSLIHYPGGGVAHPPATSQATQLSCFGMNATAVRRYYTRGMMLNHRSLLRHRPGYVDEVQRIYTHQASPGLVAAFAALSGISADKAPSNARELGNLVSTSTLQLLAADLEARQVGAGDEVCFSVVGAGPERGAFVLPISTPAR